MVAAIDGIQKGKLEVIADVLAPPAAARTAFAAENLRENIFSSGVIAEISETGIAGVG